MDDLIYKQDAIDAMLRLENEDIKAYGCCIPEGFDGKRAVKELEKLPSVQSILSTEIDEILNYLDKKLHPIVSPEHWDTYSKLHDMISQLSFVDPVIRCWNCKKYDRKINQCRRQVCCVMNPDDYCNYAEKREE